MLCVCISRSFRTFVLLRTCHECNLASILNILLCTFHVLRQGLVEARVGLRPHDTRRRGGEGSGEGGNSRDPGCHHHHVGDANSRVGQGAKLIPLPLLFSCVCCGLLAQQGLSSLPCFSNHCCCCGCSHRKSCLFFACLESLVLLWFARIK